MVSTVDISSWTSPGASDAEKALASTNLAKAFEEVGMVVIIGHGIPTTSINGCLQACKSWFEETKLEEKTAFVKGPYGSIEGGYTAIGNEKVGNADQDEGSNPADAVESFVWRGQPSVRWNGEAPSMLPAAETYYTELYQLMTIIHAMMCCALGVPENYFYSKEEGEGLQIINAPDVHSLKLSHYPGTPSPSTAKERDAASKRLRYGAHTDFQDVTILRPDKTDWTALETEITKETDTTTMVATTGGLQVYHREAQTWQPVVIQDDDALCVNLGDFWETWSHGRFRSPMHRVTASGFVIERSRAKTKKQSASGGGGGDAACPSRVSMIFFSVPNDDVVIKPLPGCPPLSNAGNKYDGRHLTAAEHLAIKLARIGN
jgi:isopenicillin N synthase-like dioxygenase